MAKTVTPKELKTWITQNPESVAIVDVRDADHFGGHITGSQNYPSSRLADKLPQIIEDTKNKDKIVFHCSLSQQRGPKAGRMFDEARKLVGENGSKPEIYILEGGKTSPAPLTGSQHFVVAHAYMKGFVNWHAHGFAKDPKITQEYDAEHWKHGFQG